MAGRLLYSLALFLVLGVVCTFTIEDAYPGKATNDDVDERAEIDKLTDEMLQMEAKQESKLKKKEKHVHEDLKIQADSPRAQFDQIKPVADRLIDVCNSSINETYRHQDRRTALRRHYNALQDADKNFISDAKFNSVIRSEKCSSCVLDKLCERANIRALLNINPRFDEVRRTRVCRRTIIRLFERFHSSEPHESEIECDEQARFRTIDGTCNNLENPEQGAVDDTFLRFVLPQYGDGITSKRLSVRDEDLPNARDVSRMVHGSNAARTNPFSLRLTHLTMNFAQFMDHDITLALEQGINCEPPTYNPECCNIEIPEDDATFRDRDVTEFELERNAPAEQDEFCALFPRQHVNEITAYIDASNVYGSTKAVEESVRAGNGFLRVMKHPFNCNLNKLLPPLPPGSFCESRDATRTCFLSGDIRNNENPGLNSVHTIFVRQHNQIAEFFVRNTDWDGERIYQETRKIVGAQLQHITYNEFLPLLISEENIERFGLKLLTGREFFTGYDPDVNAQMTAAFSTAAYRFGHTLVREDFSRLSQSEFEHRCDKCHGGNKKFVPIALLDFGNPIYLYDSFQGGVDSILTGLMKDPAGKLDKKFSSSVQENLRRGEGDLSDLVSINIQRARERGVPSYLAFRNSARCNLTRITSFEELITIGGFTEESVANLRRVYVSVFDIDLFTGVLCEPPEGTGRLGATNQCILGDQFKRLRIGDRFWYENAANAALNTALTAFTACQLEELRKSTLSQIICSNSDTIVKAPKRALEQNDIRIDCDELSAPDLRPWLPGFQCPNDSVSSDEEKVEW